MTVALREAYPDARIDVAVTRGSAKTLFEGLPELVDETIYLPLWESGRIAFIAAVLRARRRPTYDATFLAYPAARREYHVLSRLFPSKMRIAHRYYAKATLANGLRLQSELVPVETEHNVLRNMRLLDAAGIAHGMPRHYTVPASWLSREPRRPDSIVFHVGSIAHDGLENKRWPLENFTTVARHFAALQRPVFAVMGPDEREETMKLKADVPSLQVVEGTLTDVARLLSTAGVVVANDNGIAHLAAGVRTPVISLFGMTPLEFAPFGPESFPLRPSACPPCFDVRLLNTGCALNIGHRCIRQDIPPQIVVDAVERITASRIAVSE